MAQVIIATLPEHCGNTPLDLHLSFEPSDAHKLCRIRCGLVAEGAEIAGHPIRDNADAVRYLIQIAEAGS